MGDYIGDDYRGCEGGGVIGGEKLTWKPKKGPIKSTVPLKGGAIWVFTLVWGSVCVLGLGL